MDLAPLRYVYPGSRVINLLTRKTREWGCELGYLYLRPLRLKLAEYIPLLLLIVLVGVLVARRAYSSFPWFTAYVIFATLAGIARFLVRNKAAPYFYTYWYTEGGYAILGIAVMYEVFRRVFGNLGRFGWPRLLFPLMVLISAILSIGHGVPTTLHNHFIALLIQGEIAVRLLQVMIFAVLVTLV